MPQLTTDINGRRKQLLLNLISAALITVVVLAAFYKTVFQASPISRVYQLGQRDTLFMKYFNEHREGYDASVYQYFVPSHTFLTEQLRHGVIPFWNPLVGCGAPFLADVETAVFWPWRLLLLSLDPLRSWNLLIVANVLNFALGTFLLAKALRLKRFAVIFAALSCAFCPYLIFQSELIGSSASMIPLVMASFVFAQSSRKLLHKILAGMACAVMIISGHPEPSFFGIACASALYILLAAFARDAKASLLVRTARGMLDIATIGIFAFAFSAVLLLPLFELLRNSDCYKLGLTGHRDGVPLNSILINLIHPAYGNSSPYLGLLCIPLSLSAVYYGIRHDRTVQTLTACSLVFTAVMSQLGPLDWLMNSKAFSWFVPKYCWPALLVMMSLLSACGLQYLIAGVQKDWRAAAKCMTAACLLTILSLTALHLAPSLLIAIRQDEAFDHLSIINKFWIRDMIMLTVFPLLICLSKFFSKAQAAIVVAAVTLCTVLSLMPLVKLASPDGRTFKYDLVEPIPFLQKQDARIVSMGRHVFCPSSNFCYGIDNFVPVNVYHPHRFQSFLCAAGVTPEGVNQFFDGRLKPPANLAAVKYVVTPQPVLGSTERLAAPEPLSGNKTISWGEQNELKLQGADLSLFPENRELLGSLRFTVPAARAKELGVQAILQDDKNNVLWLGDIDRLLYQFSKVSDDRKVISIDKDLFVPLPATPSATSLVLQIYDYKLSKYIGSEASKKDPKLALAKCDLDKLAVSSDLIAQVQPSKALRQFKLCRETKSHVRVYENTLAEPLAYIRHSYELAKTEDDSYNKIQSNAFTPATEVLIEAAGKPIENELSSISPASGVPENLKESEAARADRASCKRDNCNKITIEVDTTAPSLLVLCETHYPGWKAYLRQGSKISELTIMRANYLFQAVAVPAGHSTVVFEFEPSGLKIGLALLALGFIALGATALLPRIRQQN